MISAFPLHDGNRLLIGSRFAGTQFLPELLCSLTGAERVEDYGVFDDCCCKVYLGKDASCTWPGILSFRGSVLYFCEKNSTFEVRIRNSFWHTGRFDATCRSYCGLLAFSAAVWSAMLNGSPLCMIHGALLQNNGKNVFLCGKSGIGKSTTCRRWRGEGGTAVADDMSLLEFRSDGIWVHPLPTWSLVAQGTEFGLYYPFAPALKLDCLLALGRGNERQELRKLQFYEYYQCVHSAVMFFYLGIFKSALPEALQQRLLYPLRNHVETLIDSFPQHYGLLANLDCNLHETLAPLF